MVELSRAHEEHIRELLQQSPVARDAIPYTDEFARLKEAFWERSFRKLTDAEFWRCVVNTAKKGGVRGKPRVDATPKLGEAHRETLLSVLPVPVGERDKLPYTDKFDRLVARFNSAAGLCWTPREVWLAVLSIAK